MVGEELQGDGIQDRQVYRGSGSEEKSVAGELGEGRVVGAISDTFLRIQLGTTPMGYLGLMVWVSLHVKGVVSWLALQAGNDFLA